MKTSIATVCLGGDLREKLEAIAAAGFQGVELFESDLLSYDKPPTDIARILTDLGLKAVALQPFSDFEGMPQPQRARNFDRAERKFDLMQEIGCGLLLVGSNGSSESLGGVSRAADDFRQLGESAAKRGLRIGYEALAWGRHIKDYPSAWDVVRRTDHPAVGLVLDSFHIFARRSDLRLLHDIPGDRIFLVQLADAPWLDMDLQSWGAHFRCFPGQGDMPLVEFVETLLTTGYNQEFSLKIFNDQFQVGSPRTVAVDGQRSLINLMDQLQGKPNAKALSIPAMPSRSKCLGVEFIEFAVDEKATPALKQLLKGLGFREVAQHKTKAVTRWSQGAINLVLNLERDGFAHSHYVMHGTSVCAIGLKVQSAAAALDRAKKLRDKPFHQKARAGELDIPAVRGVGGSLLYFLDATSELSRVWDIEFDPLRPTESAAETGLTVVDHISQSMHYEDMLSWLLFYTSLLDVRKTPLLDINDPGGIVRSQVVESTDGRLRIALNASQSHRTQSSRFLNEYFGAGVQHIAFATEDIVSTIERMKANGVPILPIPEYYYEALSDRVNLPPDRIRVLQSNNILYDCDKDGEYLQAYTKSFQGLFFFEFVERRNYDGFGAVNAPIRLTAQSRLANDPAMVASGLE
jgi:3-dehydroshikimate dehydratase